MPAALGGGEGQLNRQPACRLCDWAKGSMTVAEWIAATYRLLATGEGPAEIRMWVEETCPELLLQPVS